MDGDHNNAGHSVPDLESASGEPTLNRVLVSAVFLDQFLRLNIATVRADECARWVVPTVATKEKPLEMISTVGP
jgi:hypothetical protein